MTKFKTIRDVNDLSAMDKLKYSAEQGQMQVDFVYLVNSFAAMEWGNVRTTEACRALVCELLWQYWKKAEGGENEEEYIKICIEEFEGLLRRRFEFDHEAND